MPLMSLTRFSYMRFLAFLMWFLVAWYSFLSVGEGNYHQHIQRLCWIAYVLLCCSSNRYWGGWRSLWRPGHMNVRLLLSVEDLITLVFLFEWPVGNSQYYVTCEEINLHFFLSTVTKMLWLAFGGSADQVYLHILWRIVSRRKKGRFSAEFFGRVF